MQILILRGDIHVNSNGRDTCKFRAIHPENCQLSIFSKLYDISFDACNKLFLTLTFVLCKQALHHSCSNQNGYTDKSLVPRLECIYVNPAWRSKFLAHRRSRLAQTSKIWARRASAGMVVGCGLPRRKVLAYCCATRCAQE